MAAKSRGTATRGNGTGRRPKLLILAPFDGRYLERLRERFNVTYEPWTATGRIQNPSDLAQRLRKERINALVVEADFLTKETFSAPALRIVGVCRNGLNLVDVPAATERGIPVIHTPARNAVAVAELAVALMLALARRIPEAQAYVAAGRWTEPAGPYIDLSGRELAGGAVGIVGFGRIGREVARRVRCFGARVLACDPFVKGDVARKERARLVSLERLLRESDFVTLHTAQTPETEGMIDGPAIDLMKPGAYLISTGAGNIVDEEALAERLRARRIAGAGLDVFHGHFISRSSPLLECDNVILTPHVGGATPETFERQSRMISEDLERFFSGERPRRIANRAALAISARAR